MNVIIEYVSDVILIICLNSFLVLIINLIESHEVEKKKIENLNLKDQLNLSSVFFSSIFFALDNLILIIINKEKIIIEILIVILILLLMWVFKIKNLKIVFKVNHLIFDIIFILKPFIYYIIFITIKKVN